MLPIENDAQVSEKDDLTENGSPDPLAAPGKRAELGRRILDDIDAYCVKTYNDGHRNHLGASLIGHECTRYLWNVFRWLSAEDFSGRMLRLFQRGHHEEARFTEYLEGIGASVVEFQPDADGNANKGEQQYRIKAVMGHFGGALDGQLMLPERYGVPFGMLSEYKTKGTGRGFVQLREKGVKLMAPQHYAQMSMYGRAYGYKYALYMCVNKNDDDLHVEVVELDWTLGEELERKAFDVITAQIPPAKIAETPAYKTCKMCHFSDICFRDAPIEKNCRSCKNANAVDGGNWHCSVFNDVIPQDYIKQGCDKHTPIV